MEITADHGVKLKPENRIAEVYRIEEGRQFVVRLILEDTKEAKTFVLTEEEIQQRLEPLPSLKQGFAQKDLLPREQCLAFAEALRCAWRMPLTHTMP